LFGLEFPKSIVIAENTVEDPEHSSVVSTVSSVMEIMISVSTAKGNQIKRSPTEHISTVAIVSFPYL